MLNRLVQFVTISCVFAIFYSNLEAYSRKHSVNAFQCVGTFDPWYYSFIVSSTAGFGDIVPLSNLARSLTILHVMTLWLCNDSFAHNNMTIALIFVCGCCYLFTRQLTFW